MRRPRAVVRRLTVPLLGSVLLLFGLSSAPGAASRPVDAVKHVVVLMQENRSFDHYFGHLKAYDPTLDVEAEPADASNPNPLDPTGPPITAFHQTETCEVADLDHSWNGSHNEWNNGAMDGFTEANAVAQDPTGSRTMGYYTEQELPFYYWLYDTFAIGDQYFQSVLSQTFPNRFYLLAGTSFGHIRNDFPTSPTEFAPKNGTIFERLDNAGVSWKIYYAQVPFAFEFAYVRNHAAGHVFPIEQYFADAAAGTLPQVSYVDPIFIASNNTETDEHPPSNVQVGEKFTHDVIQALFDSPNWPSSAFFLTYDEHGGFFDHVPPPAAVPPDNIPPMLEPGDIAGAFDRYGFRDPVVVVSPFAKQHFVSHVVHDHTSILKFIEVRFRLKPLTARDKAADPMLEFFDFAHPAFTDPPATVPDAPIDPARALVCEARETGRGVGL